MTDDVQTAVRFANALATHGYLTVAVFYRNRGAGIPAIGELRARDHYILDSRAFLAAARAARDWGGDTRVALIGVSMGSYPATWRRRPLSRSWLDLQDGIEIMTSLPTAMLGNHIANTGRNKSLLTTTDVSVRRAAIPLEAFLALSPRVILAGDRSITAADFADSANTAGLTAAGAEHARVSSTRRIPRSLDAPG